MIDARRGRELLLTVLPLLVSFLAFSKGSPGEDLPSSFAANFRHDAFQLKLLVEEHQDLSEGVDLVEKLLALLESIVAPKIHSKRRQGQALISNGFPKLSILHQIIAQRTVARKQHKQEEPGQYERELQHFILLPANLVPATLRRLQRDFSKYARRLERCIGTTRQDPPSLPSISVGRSPSPEHLRSSACTIYRHLCRCQACDGEQDLFHGVKLCLHIDQFYNTRVEDVRFDLLVSTDHNHWEECMVSRVSTGDASAIAPVSDVEQRCVCTITKGWGKDSRLLLAFDEKCSWEVSRLALHHRTHSVHSLTSFDSVLQRQWPLTLLGKRILMVVLARALLQLVESPWVHGEWSRQNISFLKKPSGEEPDIRKPYLTPPKTPETDSSELYQRLHPVPGLLALGILLIEIESGKSIESARDGDLFVGGKKINTDYCTSLEVFEGLKRKGLYPKIQQVIDRCLRPAQTHPSMRLDQMDFNDDVLRRTLHQSIVEPLEDDLLSLKGEGTTIEDLKNILGLEAQCLEDRPHSDAVEHPESHIPKCNTHIATSGIKKSPSTMTIIPPKMDSYGTFVMFDDYNLDSASRAGDRLSDRWFEQYGTTFLKRLPSRRNNEHPRVKVAILDTGMDVDNPYVPDKAERLKAVRSFVASHTEDIQDVCGHGTHVAGLIRKAAPSADIYVAKISPDGQEVDEDCIVKAFEYAINSWDVDIISMSFGSHSHKAWRKLLSVLPLANSNQKKVLLFAAASNDGGNKKRAYPARFEGVFCINSCDGAGNKSSFNPNVVKDEKNFSILGEHIESAWPASLSDEYLSRRSGTSYSTPIAAGLAASVIEFLTQNLHHLPPEEGRRVLDDVRTYYGMKKVLSLMAEKRDGYDLLCPWYQLFRRDRDNASICSEIFHEVSD